MGRSFEKIRQASGGMPAVMIRQLDALAKVIDQTPDPRRRATLRAEADRIQRANLRSVPELSDQQDVTRRYAAVLWLLGDELPSA